MVYPNGKFVSDRMPHYCLSLDFSRDSTIDYVFHVCLVCDDSNPSGSRSCLTSPPHYDITCFIDGRHAPQLFRGFPRDMVLALRNHNFGRSAKSVPETTAREIWDALLEQEFTRSSEDRIQEIGFWDRLDAA
tara:strand:+ start:242 stop:637 length:396 start_codon:yes stop_codon:yes gene_type:complete